MNPAEGVTIAAIGVGWFFSVAGVIVWAVRLEGRVNLEQERSAALALRCDALLRQIEEYRSHTDGKLDRMSDEIKIELRRIFEKLDTKVDR